MRRENKADLEIAAQPFRLGDCDVDPSTCRIRHGGETVKLQPQAFEVLNYLIGRSGQVASREDIEEAVWAGKTVGYDALTGTMFKLRKALGDDTKQPRLIETIPKKGYRLLVSPQPTTELIAHREGPVDELSVSPPFRYRRSSAYIFAAILVAVLAAALVWVATAENQLRTGALDASERAIVVLPFVSFSTSNNHDPWAEGLTDDLTTALAQIPELLVIARDSAFVYRGQKFDHRDIGSRLKVRYALRGTIRKIEQRLRINVQLLDTKDGKHIWADQYEGPNSRIYELQDEIVRKIVSSLADRIGTNINQETVLARTNSPAAYEAFLLGRQHFYKYLNKSENQKARAFFNVALKHDWNFATAHAMLAWTYAFDAMNGWSDDRSASLKTAQQIAQRAIAIDPRVPLSYFVTGLVFREQKEYVKALVEAEKAISYEPNYANAHVLLATLLYYAGRPEESVERLQKAIRLNPHHPFNYTFHLGQAYYTLRRYELAVATFQKGIASNPESERLHVWLAASLAQAGRLEDAAWEVDQILVLNPEFKLLNLTEAFPYKDPADQEHFLAGLRKAGLS